MGSRREGTRVLGLEGFHVEAIAWNDDGAHARTQIRIERRGIRRYECSGCRRRTWRVRDRAERTWDDLPWAEHRVTLVYQQRRIYCRTCGIRTERIAFADPKARITRRFRQLIGLDCQSMPTSHAAVHHGVSWSKARRAERAFLCEWDETRPRRRPRHLGADEIHRGKAQKFYTVLSDLVHGEVLGLAPDRTESSLTRLLTMCLDARQRAAVEAVCTDMHRPYVQQQLAACDTAIEAHLQTLTAHTTPPTTSLPPPRPRQKPRDNEPRFELRTPLHHLTGVDLSQLDGIGPYNALRLLSEIGTDMTRWPTDKHFTSWLTLAPNNRISGGRLLSSRTQPSANRAAAILRLGQLGIWARQSHDRRGRRGDSFLGDGAQVDQPLREAL
jgi:hypothetical protein